MDITMPDEYDLSTTFLHKAVREDEYDFWPNFCDSILGKPHEPLRNVPTNHNLFGFRLGKAYQVVVEPQYTPLQKRGFSKPQSTSVVAPKASLWTPIFGHNRDTPCLVGMRFSPEDNLPNSFDLYDAGSVYAPHRRFTSPEEAQEVADLKLKNKKAFSHIEFLIRGNVAINSRVSKPKINEAKYRLKMTCSPANQITIGTDNLQSRLLAQVRAQDLYRHMKNNMPLPSSYKSVPISFYIPTSKKLKTYTNDEQTLDRRSATTINSSKRDKALALFARLSEDNFENFLVKQIEVEQFYTLFGELIFIASKLTHSTSTLFFDKIVLACLSHQRLQSLLITNTRQTDVIWKNIFTMLPHESREAYFSGQFKQLMPELAYGSVERGYLLAEMWRRDLSTEKVNELKTLMKKWQLHFSAHELNDQLINASKKGLVHTIDILICARERINLNYKDSRRYSSIDHASDHGHTEVVNSLLKAGAVPDSSSLSPPIYWAAKGGNKDIVILLLNTNNLSTDSITHAFNVALSTGHVEVVGLLMTALWIRKASCIRRDLYDQIRLHANHGQLHNKLKAVIDDIYILLGKIDCARDALGLRDVLFNSLIALKACEELASKYPNPGIDKIQSEIQAKLITQLDVLFHKDGQLYLNEDFKSLLEWSKNRNQQSALYRKLESINSLNFAISKIRDLNPVNTQLTDVALILSKMPEHVLRAEEFQNLTLFLITKLAKVNHEVSTLFTETYDYVHSNLNKKLQPMFLQDPVKAYQQDLKFTSELVIKLIHEGNLKKLIDILLLLPKTLHLSELANTIRDAIAEALSKKLQDNEFYFLTDEFFEQWQRTSRLVLPHLDDFVDRGRGTLNQKLHSVIHANDPVLIEAWLREDNQDGNDPASLESWIRHNRRFDELYPNRNGEKFYNCLNFAGENPIISAAKTGNLPLLQTLFNEIPGAGHKEALSGLDYGSNSALKWAASSAHVDVLDFLLEKQALLFSPEDCIKAIFRENRNQESAFHIAVVKGHSDVILHFLKTIHACCNLDNFVSILQQVDDAMALNAEMSKHPDVRLKIDSMHLDFAPLSINDLISKQKFSSLTDVKLAVEMLFNKMIEMTDGVVRENLQQYRATLDQDFDKTWRLKEGKYVLVNKDYYNNILINYEHILKYKSIRNTIDAVPKYYDKNNPAHMKQVGDMLSLCEQFLVKDSYDYSKKINALGISPRLKEKAGMLAGSLIYALGVSVFVVIGFSVGLALGILIGGGAGSVAPIFGNVAGAIASGAVGAVVGSLKAASLGALITAGVCSAMGIKVSDKLLPSVSTVSTGIGSFFLNKKQREGNLIRESLSRTIQEEQYKPVAAPAA